MKTQNIRASLLAIATVATFAFVTGNVTAQNSAAVTPDVATSVAPATTPQLSYGVTQIMKMVQAKVSDTIIVNYVQNSGIIYPLKADEIIYLKQQDVSDAVLNAMLTQRARLTGSTEPAAAPTPAPAPAPAYTYTQPPGITADSGAAYVPANSGSMVYVIPSTQSYSYYNGAYPVYYYPYYSYPYYNYWPVSFSFGYYGGSCYRGGCYYGGRYCGNGWGSGVRVSGFYGSGFHGGSSFGGSVSFNSASRGGVHASGFSGGGMHLGGGWHH